MVQVLPAVKKPLNFGAAFGQGIGEALPGAVEKFTDQILQNKENEALKKQYGVDLQGIQDPALRHQITQDELAFGRKMKQAKAGQKVNYARKPGESVQSDETGKEGKNFPQAQTQGQKIPLMTPDQLMQEGQRIAAERTDAGVPTTVEEGLALASATNQQIAQYNQMVEGDVQSKKAAQIDYGQQSVDKLIALYPEATDEQQAIFRKMGENEAYEGMSEGDINKEMAKEATKFKNTIANVKDSIIEPKRIFSRAKESLLGTGRDVEKERDSVRVQVKPLLDMGLYDTTRMLLADKGYYPEERESIISSLGEGPSKALATMPKIEARKESFPLGFRAGGTPVKSTKEAPYTESQRETFSNTLSEAIKSDPSVNLVLLRKAFDDKGVRWDLYKDAIDTAIINGDLKLNDDQFKQLKYLETPPLNNLERALYNFGLMGR